MPVFVDGGAPPIDLDSSDDALCVAAEVFPPDLLPDGALALRENDTFHAQGPPPFEFRDCGTLFNDASVDGEDGRVASHVLRDDGRGAAAHPPQENAAELRKRGMPTSDYDFDKASYFREKNRLLQEKRRRRR